jgi:hypothetical protein
MGFSGTRWALAGALVAGFYSSVALGVEAAPIRVGDRWAVVGVIAGNDAAGKAIGIAVLKNTATQRTYTVSLGEGVPTEYGFVLSAVHDRQVEISDGRQKIMLGFAEGSGKEEEDDNDRTARFLDNYYRSLGSNSHLEVLAGEDDGSGRADESGETEGSVDGDAAGEVLPLKRFGNLKDEGDSRFELYRPDRTYRFGSESGDRGEIGEGSESGEGLDSSDSSGGTYNGYGDATDDNSFRAPADSYDDATRSFEGRTGADAVDAVDAETGEPIFVE